ncbi:MAG TPA: response regulator transcription factor [Polyangiaceae bacterium]|nr:response regulator transcription factor [Polyangiaceae bacterium]
MPTILVVDDEPRIRDVVEYALGREGFDVVAANNGEEALDKVRAGGIDLIVLDVLMPELDGLSVCRSVRAVSQVPIIFLSSRAEEVDRIMGLELGGDDYVTKPFSPRELTTRVKAVLRRTSGAQTRPSGDSISHGDVEIDRSKHEVKVRGERVTLTVTEFSILETLLEQPGRLFTRAQLIQRAYAHDNHITERTVDTHVRRIRSKLRPFDVDVIETVHGLGYRAAEL